MGRMALEGVAETLDSRPPGALCACSEPLPSPMNDAIPRRGIILAGGSGTRLHPATLADEQAAAAGLRQADGLLPAQHADAGRHPRHPRHQHAAGHAALPGSCSATARSGASTCSYCVQPSPDGLAQAFILGRDFVGGAAERAGARRQHLLRPRPAPHCSTRGDARASGAIGLRLPRARPGALRRGRLRRRSGAPSASRKSRRAPKSNYAVTGLYFYDDRRLRHRRRRSSPRRAASSRSPTSTRATSSAAT